MHTAKNYDTFVKENGYCHWKERQETCQAIIIDEVLSQVDNPNNEITDDGMIYCGNLLNDILKRLPEMPILPGTKYGRADRKYFDKESRYEFLNEDGKRAYLLPILDLFDPKYCNKYNYKGTPAKDYPCIYRNGSCENYYVDPKFADNYIHLVDMNKVNKARINLNLTNQVNNVVETEQQKEVCCFKLKDRLLETMDIQQEKQKFVNGAKVALSEANKKVREIEKQLAEAKQAEITAAQVVTTAYKELEESEFNAALAAENLSNAYKSN